MKPHDVVTARRVPLIFRYGTTWFVWTGARLHGYRTWRGAVRSIRG